MGGFKRSAPDMSSYPISAMDYLTSIYSVARTGFSTECFLRVRSSFLPDRALIASAYWVSKRTQG